MKHREPFVWGILVAALVALVVINALSQQRNGVASKPVCSLVCHQKHALAGELIDLTNLGIDHPAAMWMLYQATALELQRPIYRQSWAQQVRGALRLFARATAREARHRLCHWEYSVRDQVWIGDNCEDVSASLELIRERADDLLH